MFGGITVFVKVEFIESVIERGLSRYDIVDEALSEIHRAESHLQLVIGAPTNPVHSPTALIGTPTNRAAESSDHVRFLRSLVFFLECDLKVKPARLSDDEFQFLLPLAQHLVDQDGLNPDILELSGAR